MIRNIGFLTQNIRVYKLWNMDWKNFSMKWNILMNMEYGKFPFHSIACLDHE